LYLKASGRRVQAAMEKTFTLHTSGKRGKRFFVENTTPMAYK